MFDIHVQNVGQVFKRIFIHNIFQGVLYRYLIHSLLSFLYKYLQRIVNTTVGYLYMFDIHVQNVVRFLRESLSIIFSKEYYTDILYIHTYLERIINTSVGYLYMFDIHVQNVVRFLREYLP